MRRKKKKRFSYGMMILLMLFVLAGLRVTVLQEREEEVLQNVRESDLQDLLRGQDSSNAGHTESKESDNENPDIRVLIMGDGYRGVVHSTVSVSSKGKMCLAFGEIKEDIEAGEKLVLKPDDQRFENGIIRISSEKKIKLEHLKRGYGTPSYEGIIELRATAEGIVIINELSVEKYLKAVVPSEMPASYELEALKAQAVCARSYACQQMKEYGYPEYEAHVNDSTAYQVYGNSKLQDSTNQAVEETEGQVVYYRDEIVTTYYYSTSCGKTTDIEAWGTKKSKKNAYLKAVKVKGKSGDYEKELPWYRWKAEIPVETLSNLIGLNTGKDIGLLKNVKVTKRGGGDVALEIEATGEQGKVVVKTENKIRSALGGSGYQIVLNDGSVTDSRELLPSAFFTIEKSGNVFVIEGGGFGHGIGMSQNGANEMAKQGMSYREILELFYQDIEIR